MQTSMQAYISRCFEPLDTIVKGDLVSVDDVLALVVGDPMGYPIGGDGRLENIRFVDVLVDSSLGGLEFLSPPLKGSGRLFLGNPGSYGGNIAFGPLRVVARFSEATG